MFAALLCMQTVAFAHDFAATVNGQQLYFSVNNKTKKTVTVTYKGSIAEKNAPEVAGKVEIPAKVKHENVTYEVSAIGQKAFSHATRMTALVIPSGVETIGDFAFEGCDSLKSIVFPGNAVRMGQGIFYGCTGIELVTIGSDWTAIDLSMFRWSDSLTSVTIPAKVEKIQGVKKLKGLKNISVDPNNTKFAADGGLLYNKDYTILYACPRAYVGKATVKDGTTTVTTGAFMDCPRITALDFPSTLKSISFRETSRMKELEYIVMRGETPISTAYSKEGGTLLFRLANAETQLIVPGEAKSKYLAGTTFDAGEYSETANGVPYVVSSAELLTKKRIKGVKSFDKY
jgi:hypothetical protein